MALKQNCRCVCSCNFRRIRLAEQYASNQERYLLLATRRGDQTHTWKSENSFNLSAEKAIRIYVRLYRWSDGQRPRRQEFSLLRLSQDRALHQPVGRSYSANAGCLQAGSSARKSAENCPGRMQSITEAKRAESRAKYHALY